MQINIVTWNVLADCYSFGLEKDQGHTRLHHLSWKRWSLIQKILNESNADIICLQEVDHFEDCYSEYFSQNGFKAIYLKRNDREDGCLTAYKQNLFHLEEKLEIQFDDLAEPYTPSMKQKYLRQNCALILKLSIISNPHKSFWVSNSHLFWNPNYPEVKLAQSCYLFQRIENVRTSEESVLFLGDFNSLPTSEVYIAATKGSSTVNINSITRRENVKFLCDSSLHRFCRWLRILGVDTALETSEEHEKRSAGDMNPLFDRCRTEGRVLLTTSKSVTHRRQCPESSIISVKNFQNSLVQLCKEFALTLNPDDFLTKCVKCNGLILPCESSDPRLQQTGQNIPPNIPIYLCSGCSQAYWWSELHNSSAVRAKKAADTLYELVREQTETQTETVIVSEDSVEKKDDVEVAEGERGIEELSCESNVMDILDPYHVNDHHLSMEDIGPMLPSCIKEKEVNRLCVDNYLGVGDLTLGETKTESETETGIDTIPTMEDERVDGQDVYQSMTKVIKMKPSEGLNLRHSTFPAYRSAMASVSATGEEPLLTNWNGGFRGTLDYIFVSDGIIIDNAVLLPIGFGEESWSVETPPNALWPSDHALIRCSFTLATEKSD
eukprot:gene5919-11947_t